MAQFLFKTMQLTERIFYNENVNPDYIQTTLRQTILTSMYLKKTTQNSI